MEITGFRRPDGSWISANEVVLDENRKPMTASGEPLTGVRVSPTEVKKQGEAFVLASSPEIKLESRAHKMSKSRGNVINPDVVVREYGADSLRLYEMFMGPLEATKPWSMDGVNGVRGFLDRVWRMMINDRAEAIELNAAVREIDPTVEQNRVLHRTIQAVTQDLDKLSFNTAIARMMEFTNFFIKADPRPRGAMEKLVLLLSPFAPHMAEELWQILGHKTTLAYEPWPQADESLIAEDTVEVPVQVNGKLRGLLTVPVDSSREDLESAARSDARITSLLADKTIQKVIVVPGRLVNFVIR
jgi:leucyl-tRNA synthetase